MRLKPTITARVIEDSISPARSRVITLQLRYPRIVHAEQLTHRSQAKNSGSSRAIPVKKMLAQIFNDPAMPVEWGSNKPGMQAGAELTGWRLFGVRTLWSLSAKTAAFFSWGMMKLGAHKQVANRVTEPYQYMNTVITATMDAWLAYAELRCHEAADPTLRDLAIEIMAAIEVSTPMPLGYDEWHLPYVSLEERKTLPLAMQLKLSTARCARVSIEPFDGDASHKKEEERHNLLVGSRPVHASPTEHQCRPMGGTEAQHGNLKGWRQYRFQVEALAKQIDIENKTTPSILRRAWTAAEHKEHERRLKEVNSRCHHRWMGDLSRPLSDPQLRGDIFQGGFAKPATFSRVLSEGPEMVLPLRGLSGQDFMEKFGTSPEEASGQDPLASKAAGQDQLTSVKVFGEIRNTTREEARAGYAHPLSDPHSHDAPLAGQEKPSNAFSTATQAYPSTHVGSGAGSDSGSSTDD